MNTSTTISHFLRRKVLGFALGLVTVSAFAQQPQGIQLQSDAVKLPLMSVEKMNSIKFTEMKDDWNPVLKTVRTIHQPGTDLKKDEFLRLKALANAERDALAGSQPATSAQKVSSTTPPTQGVHFFGNNYDFSDPADNSVGVSAEGKIVSASNTRVHIYQPTGTQISSSSLGGFVQGSGQPVNFTFDPKVSYDVQEDKYIVVFLNGASSSNSRIIICFSETNDPAGNWNVYGINGNLDNLGVWTDFPQIGVNTNELFITGNLFDGNSQSQGGAIWQITKADGYAGNPLTIQSYYLPSNFSLHPVEGQHAAYGPYMYFLESNNSGSNAITLHRITNSIANNGVLENPYAFTMNTSYSIPPDADQRGSANDLACNDSRIQTSYFANNRIEFAMNTGFSGRCALFHGTAIISPFLLSFSSFGGEVVSPGSDISAAYPSLAYAGDQLDGSNKSYLAFNYCSPSDFPGCGVVLRDSSGTSPMMVAKVGVSAINSAQSRWGDYADIQTRINGLPGEAWMVGTYGNSSSQQRTYVSQVLPPTPVAVSQPIDQTLDITVYPNPSVDRVTFDFPVSEAGIYRVDIHDMQGKLVHTVIEDWLRVGEGRVSFNTTALSAGTYVVSVQNGASKLFQDRFVVTK
jgi:hypothetical protein